MDTLSTSISTLTVPTTCRRKSFDVFSHFIKTPLHLNNPSFSSSSSSKFLSSTRRNSFSNHKSTNNNSSSDFLTAAAAPPSFRNPPAVVVKNHPPPPAAVHRRAASGYAAALVDVAKCHGSLDAVQRDVRRVWKWIRNYHIKAVLVDPMVNNKEKGEILKEIAEKGKVHKLLRALLKTLGEKNKAVLLSQVLEEFERIYDELFGTARVVM